MEWITFEFGFSWIGLLALLLLLIPNLLWTKNKPQGYDPGEEDRLLGALEKVGQVLVTTLVLIQGRSNLLPRSLWVGWLAAAGVFMALYEGFWIRYFKSEHTLEDFYGSYCGVPVAGATLPIMAFLCLSVYGKSLWLLLAVVILGIGHIGIHLQHREALLCGKNKENNT